MTGAEVMMSVDPLEALFLFCLVFGLAMSAISLLLGWIDLPGVGDHGGHEVGGDAGGAGGHEIGDAAHVQAGHGDGGHAMTHDPGAHHGPGGHAHHDGPSPFNVNTATAFLAFFGAVGYILYGTLGVAAAVALVLATLAGLGGGAIVFFFLVRVLLAGQRFLDPADFQMEGCVAEVTRPIRPDGIGEIVFTKDGTRRSEGARSATGEAIPEGAEVVIVRYEGGIAYVQPWKSFVGEA